MEYLVCSWGEIFYGRNTEPFHDFWSQEIWKGPEYSKEKLKISNTISYFLFGKRSFETRDAENIKEVLVHQSENLV